MVAVGDKQAVARFVRQHLAGERQQSGRLIRAFQRQFNRHRGSSSPVLSKIIDHPADQAVERLERDFARLHRQNIAARIDDDEGRPGIDAVGAARRGNRCR